MDAAITDVLTEPLIKRIMKSSQSRTGLPLVTLEMGVVAGHLLFLRIYINLVYLKGILGTRV